MLDIAAILTASAVCAAGVMSPGPNFVAVTHRAVTNLSNPKAMAFYASVFSAAVPAGASPATLLVMVGMVAVIALLWYGGVALVLSSARVVRLYRGAKAAVERSCGVFLIVFGLRQAVVRQ